MRTPVVIALLVVAAALMDWLRFPEPLGLDQSLFAFYGEWIGRGLTLYRDLWDSKPPGIFVLYAGATRIAGTPHAAWWLDACAALAAGILAWRLVRALGGSGGASASAAAFAAFAPSAPVFGGPMLAAQAEPLQAPLLLAAAWWARRTGARTAFVCGALLGVAVLVKLAALVWLPMAWVLAPAAVRRDRRRALAIVAGVALPLVSAAVVLAARGALEAAIEATLVYPQAYAAEIAARTALGPAMARAAWRFLRGAPLLWVWAAAACVGSLTRVRPLLIWVALAALGALVQQQMAGYQLYALVAPLAILAGLGAARWLRALRDAWIAARRGRAVAAVQLAVLTAVVAVPVALEARLWAHHYAPHAAHRAGRIDTDAFHLQLGGSGPRWREARALADVIRAAGNREPGRDAGRAPALLVWGLAPEVYALAHCRPATRFAFHQTFYVEDAPLARRFPDVAARRAELVARFDRDPPRWVVVVHGDRSGFEPADSATELQRFPALATRLEQRYRLRTRTRSLELRERVD